MDASQLKEPIKFQAPVSVGSESGEVVNAWQTKLLARAKVTPLMSRERFLASENRSIREYTIVVRYFPALTSLWRIMLGEDALKISGIAMIGRRQWWEITAGVID